MNLNDVFVIQCAQILDFSQGSDWETLVEHVFHYHFQFLQREVLHFFSYWVYIFGLIYFTECSFSNFFNVLEIG